MLSPAGRVVAPTVLAVFALVLTGCAGDSGSTGRQNRPTVRAEPGALPVTVEHKYGSTTIEKTPQRVATVGYTDQDTLSALDVIPSRPRTGSAPTRAP